MLQGLVEGLVDVSVSLMKLSSRLDFFFFIIYLPGMSLIQMTEFCLSEDPGLCVYAHPSFCVNLLTCLVGDNDLDILLSILLDNIYVFLGHVVTWPYLKITYTLTRIVVYDSKEEKQSYFETRQKLKVN